jgi:uncharacterized membrane protein
VVIGNLANFSTVMVFLAIPREVIWSYSVAGLVIAVGLTMIYLRGDWQKARGLEKVILFGPIFYAAPLAAFGTEHFTFAAAIASMVPVFVPWHMFWALFIGVCFIVAALSMVTGILARLAASLVALNFFLFVMLMDLPAWLQDPRDRIALTLVLRELTFSGGALALAASLTTGPGRERTAHIMATIARYFVAIPVLFYSFEQFIHGDHVPGVPLERLTPTWIPGHAIWTYVAAVGYLVGGIPLLLGKKTRAAAAWVGLTVLFVELVVYLPIGVADRATIVGLNFVFDTLMFCGAVLLLARAMPREESRP